MQIITNGIVTMNKGNWFKIIDKEPKMIKFNIQRVICSEEPNIN